MIEQAPIDALRGQAIPDQSLLIDGGKVKPVEGGPGIEVVSPIDGAVLCTLAEGSAADVDRAVAAARRSFDSGAWSRAKPAERKARLLALAGLIERHALELAVLGVRDNGTEISMAYKAEPLSAAATFRYYAEAVDKIYGEIAPTADNILGLVQREPVGVVGAIIPWNFPLMIGTWKVAPALAAGNSVVLKPSETASLSTLRVAELALEAGIPPGVFNVVTGRGSVVGKALGLHNDVDVLAFTGGGAVGRQLHEYAAQSNLKRLYLELGGKSPNIIFSDAPDLNAAAKAAVNGMFRNSGQVCISGTRLLVQENIADEFLEKLLAHTAGLRVGDPLSLDSDVGAIASEGQLKQDLAYVEKASQEGARLLTGGERLHAESGGYYMQPTIFDKVTPQMTIAREEVFGPVLSVLSFRDEAEAAAIANATAYGLAAGIWTSDLGTAHRMIKAVKSGLIHVNCYGGSDLTVPLGGVKQSGNGHDKSLHALEKYMDIKSAWIQI